MKSKNTITVEVENKRFDLIREWAETRGLYEKGDVKTQYLKLGSEFGELGDAIIDQNQEEIQDAIGDMVVVLTNLAHLAGFTIEDCIDSAYKVISKRTGKMVNGSFIKDVPVEENKNVDVYECLFQLATEKDFGFEIGCKYVSPKYDLQYLCGNDTLYLDNGNGICYFVNKKCFKKVE